MKRFGGYLLKAPIIAVTLAILSLQSTSADPVTFESTAKKYVCPAAGNSDTPTRLDDLSLDKGTGTIHYILLEPQLLSRQLCTLTRVNDAFKKRTTYIPIARAYDDHPNWTKTGGRYMSSTEVICGEADADGPDGTGYKAGETLCQIKLGSPLLSSHDGYYLNTYTVPEKLKEGRSIAAAFLEKVTFGGTITEIGGLARNVNEKGAWALAEWLKNNLAKPISSHRAHFRRKLHPRAVESYLYGIPGPRPCEANASFRRFAFTYMDAQISGGRSSPAGHNGYPFTPMKIQTIQIHGVPYYAVKFGDHIRTILSQRLQYYSVSSRSGPSGDLVDLGDGEYTICNAEEVLGDSIGDKTFSSIGNYAFQILLSNDKCTSSYTNRGGVSDGKGDGSLDGEGIKVGASLVRAYDAAECRLKCDSDEKVRYVKGGNPEVTIPSGFDTSTISFLDLNDLSNPAAQLVNLNPDKFHDSSWRMTANLETSLVSDPPSCIDKNGNTIPDAAGSSYNDYSSVSANGARGKFSLDAPIFAKMPNGKWALHDYRSKFQANTLENPLLDAGGSEMKRARRAVDGVPFNNGNHNVDLVTRCSNVQPNIFNEAYCQISYDANACETVPLPGERMENPSSSFEDATKYIPPYAGRAVLVCGSENEVAPDQSDDDYYAVENRKLDSDRIDHTNQIRTVWMEQALYAEDQACQKLAWQLSKIFAYANGHGSTEMYINTYDWSFVATCASTYADVVNRITHSVSMGEQLTFIKNKSAAYEYHRNSNRNVPDENYARENLQLHQIGLPKLHEDGSLMLDRYGKPIPNYNQDLIFSSSKIFTGLSRSYRRGNYNDLDWSTTSYLDPLVQQDETEKDWFPKIGFDDSYVGDKYPLCADLPERHFLKSGAKYVALGGNPIGRYHHTWNTMYTEGDEAQQLKLNYEGGVYPDGTTFAASELFLKLCNLKTSFQQPSSLLTQGNGVAAYDTSLQAPKCSGMVSSCDSGTLLQNQEGQAFEENKPNTVDTCTDGEKTPLAVGAEQSAVTESVEKIVVKSLSGSNIRGGSWVYIEATVTANHKNDKVDYYFAADAANPEWTFITTVSPVVGSQTVAVPRASGAGKVTFQLPNCDADHCDVAFRVALRSSREINNSGNWRNGSNSNDGQHKPSNNCAKDPYDDTDDLVLQVLPSPHPKDMCDLQPTITLDEDLPTYCDNANMHMECRVDTIRVVELLPGVYYEYVRPPCVNMPIIDSSQSVKVFANYNMEIAICADKRLPSASSLCCGGYSDRLPNRNTWGDILSEYREERLTYERNIARCVSDWGRSSCIDPERVGPFSSWAGQCQHRQSCKDHWHGNRGQYMDSIRYHWTSRSCDIKVKIDVEGMVAIVHAPDETGATILNSAEHSKVLPMVDFDSTVSFFAVHWDRSGVAAGRLAYPHVGDNQCSGGEIRDDFCFCSTSVADHVVFSSLPTKAEVLDQLHIGAFAPSAFGSTYQLLESSAEVEVYQYENNGYTLDTIFKVTNDYNGAPLYLKNVRSVVSVCDGTFTFRSPPSFYNLANPDLVSATQEMEAYLQSVINHDSAPPFTCTILLKLYGFSNPSAAHVLRCSQAFKSGTFVFTDPENERDPIQFGSGNRSDMMAILASIVLSPESYSPSAIMDPASGGVQDPLEKYLHVLRSMKIKRSLHHRRTDGLIGNSVGAIGVGVHAVPDQFSFYSPEFIPPKFLLEAGLYSPAGELATLNGIVGLSNALFALPRYGLSSCTGGLGEGWGRNRYFSCGNYHDGLYTNSVGYPSYSQSDASIVVDELAVLFTSGRLSAENREIIEAQFQLIYDNNEDNLSEAQQVAAILIMSTPEFHTWNTVSTSGTAREATPLLPKNAHMPYRAIVHINLFGGMDSMNMLTPHPDGCLELYNEYREYRGNSNSLASSSLVKIDATTSDHQPCTYFGVHTALNKLAQIYADGDAIFFANIGHMQKAVNKYNYRGETRAQLFSHHSMKDEMMKVDAFGFRSGSGVMGRMGDIFSATSASIGQTGVLKSPTILKGDPSLANPVNVVKTGGLDAFYHGREICKAPAAEQGSSCSTGSENSRRSALLEKIQNLNKDTKETSSLQAEFWSQAFIDAIADTDSFRNLLSSACSNEDGSSILCDGSACACGGPYSPNNDLGKRLDIVFRLMALNDAREVNRDFFAVELAGFDTHFEMVDGLKSKFDIVNPAIDGFRRNLEAAVLSDGTTLWDHVTVVMSSEFGRTISPNSSSGTDHGWGGNSFLMGGPIRGGQVLGLHPDTYSSADDYNTGRGIWIPRTPWEAKWYGIVQWMGITDDALINYVLPNAVNFGCNLYSEVDLYTDGAASLSGCGGDVVQLQQNFLVSEARILTPEEQVAFCAQVAASVGTVDIRCVILNQFLSQVATDPNQYEIQVYYEVNFDETVTNGEGEEIVTETIDTVEFRTEAAQVVQMEEVIIEEAVVVTSNPSESPSLIPSEAPDICTTVTSTIFSSLFPNLSQPYTYAGFCSAANDWNVDHPDKQIFAATKGEVKLRHELAAFFGHVLHESNGLQEARESEYCSTTTTTSDGLFCQPNGYSGGTYTDPYCNENLNPSSDPDGCTCPASLSDDVQSGYIAANALYFGRGPLQLSHNYNYIDAGTEIGQDLCAEPDLVATDEVVGWNSAFWFWTSSLGSTGKTCAEYVEEGSFGGTLKTINGGFECPTSSYSGTYQDSVEARLNHYCNAATLFGVEALLAMNNCNLLLNTLENCVTTDCTNCQVWTGVTLPPSSSPSESMKPSAEPSSNPSQSMMPSGKPSQSLRPSTDVIIESYYGHTFVGDGNCYGKKDGNSPFLNSLYDYIEIQDSAYGSATKCPGACATYRTNSRYRGFEFETGTCRCLFDDTTDLQQINDVEENTAQGDIQGSINADVSIARCYKISSPVAPEVVSGFEYIGFGDCRDDAFATYTRVAITLSSYSIPSCGDACSLTNYPLSKGFFTNEDPAVCECLFDAGYTDGVTEAGTGTGQIASSDYLEGHCYRALPAPTNFPTKMPTPPPTPRPTFKITSAPSDEPSGLPSDNPSLTPSKSTQPSSEPSLAPSESFSPSESSIPTSEPSLDPSSINQNPPPSSAPSDSSSPSDIPSSQPSLTPSESAQPSSGPSESDPPSMGPSLSPSKSSVPSSSPSGAPSLTPSQSSRPSNPDPTFEATFRLSVTLETVTVNVASALMPDTTSRDAFLEALRVQVRAQACSDNARLKGCDVEITHVDGLAVADFLASFRRDRLLRSRRLTTNLDVEFNLLLTLICNDDCSDADTTSTLIYTSATGDLETAFQDGSFIAGLIADSSLQASVDDILTAAGVAYTVYELIVPILALAKSWYPDWDYGEVRCKNDGDAPAYMSVGGNWWHEDSKEECCKKYFSWAYEVCAGASAAVIDGYYPVWGDVDPQCDSGDPPSYMRKDPKNWIFDTAEKCCENYFGWDPNCVVNSGGVAPVDLTADLYYADWANSNTCVSDGNAPGYVKASPKIWMYDTLLECCKANYFWGEEYVECITSEGADAPTSSPIDESWYVDWASQECVKSCEGANPCGGIHKEWNILHPSLFECCKEHLWWKKECKRGPS